jgi:hypothetical protein
MMVKFFVPNSKKRKIYLGIVAQQCHISCNLEIPPHLPREMRISKGDDTSPNFGICDTTQIFILLIDLDLLLD